MEWVQGEGVDAILAGREPTPLREPTAAPTTGRRENRPNAYDQLRDAVDRLRTEAQADPDVDPGHVDAIEDLGALVYALRRLGYAGFRRAAIDVADSYRPKPEADDPAHQVG